MQSTDRENAAKTRIIVEATPKYAQLFVEFSRLLESVAGADFDWQTAEPSDAPEPSVPVDDLDLEEKLTGNQRFFVTAKTDPDSLESRVLDRMKWHNYPLRMYVKDAGKVPVIMRKLGMTKTQQGVGFVGHVLRTAQVGGFECLDFVCNRARGENIRWQDLTKEDWDRFAGEYFIHREGDTDYFTGSDSDGEE